MKSAAALMLLFAPLTMAPAQSSVWKITRDGGTVYLGARCHMLRPADFPLPAEFDAAYAAAEILVFETDLTRLQSPQAQQQIVALGQQGSAGSLQHDLSPEAWAQVEKYCARTGAPLGRINQLRPWFFAFIVSELEMQKLGVTSEGVDRHYLARALNDGRERIGLESFEQRVELITQLGAGRESDLVQFSLVEASLVASWRAGDLATMDMALNDNLRRNLPAIYDTLIVRRNRAWRPQIVALLQTTPVEFVIVDGAHLPGPNGLIAGILADGGLVEQVDATPEPDR